MRRLFPAEVLRKVERRARAIGVSADRVLIAAGWIDEESYLRRLAATLRIRFETLEGADIRGRCPLSDEQLLRSASVGIIPLRFGAEEALVIAPRGVTTRRLLAMLEGSPHLAPRICLTTSEHMNRFIVEEARSTIAQQATSGLCDEAPEMSSAPPGWRNSSWLTTTIGAAAFALLLSEPHATLIAFEAMLACVFLSWIGLRLAGLFVNPPAAPERAAISDDALPVYTIMVALYREASSVPNLVKALDRLDYPHEKLDIRFVIEKDDLETRAALEAVQSKLNFDIFESPDSGPRTKPKALNAALPFARGSFLVIYDAEDRPEPDQLRRALSTFLSKDDAHACVQASLTIDNTDDNWLTALFTAEYAGQFDVFLPAMASLNLPLPLGGSSNHFRTWVLRRVGAWDPYNVTEDADLGMRLARHGYRTGVIDTTTYEEAPGKIGPWIRQRTRWFKGWIQTWLVHMRQPRRLLRELGLPGFVALQLMVGGNVLAALVHPIFLAIYAWPLMFDEAGQNQFATTFLGLSVAMGYLASALLAAIGLARRRLLRAGWALLFIPAHWILLSIAAWRALCQLIVNPYLWEKTEHGRARTSRHVARQRADAFVAEIMAKAAAAAGHPVRNTAANQRPPPARTASD